MDITWKKGIFRHDEVKDPEMERASWIIQVGPVDSPRFLCEVTVMQAHKPRNTGSLEKLEKAGSRVSPGSSRKTTALQTPLQRRRQF